MPLNSTIPARNDLYQDIQYVKKAFTFADTGAKTIGTLPSGAIIVRAISGLYVTQVFNAGTLNVVDIGTTADDDLYGTDLSGTTLGHVPLDENVSLLLTADTTFTVTPGLTGTAATTGAATAVIAYILPQ
jgi:hypothetical protein